MPADSFRREGMTALLRPLYRHLSRWPCGHLPFARVVYFKAPQFAAPSRQADANGT